MSTVPSVAYGLKQEHLGKKFVHKGQVFTVCGLRLRARKYPVAAKAQDGKRWRFPAAYVKNLIVEVDV